MRMNNITYSPGFIEEIIPLSSKQGFSLSRAMTRVAESAKYIDTKQGKDLLLEAYTLRKESIIQKALEKRINKFMLSRR